MKRCHWIGMLPFYLLALISVVGLSSWGSRMVEVSVAESPIQRGTYMVIDAGHGGPDGGATSCTGVLESELNLQIAESETELYDLMCFVSCPTCGTRMKKDCRYCPKCGEKR